MIKSLIAVSLVAVSLMLTGVGCSSDVPDELDTSSLGEAIGSGSGSGSGSGTCRYICTRIVGGNEYQLDDTDPNNPPNRCAAGKSCTAPNSLTCATPGLILNTTCS